MCEIFRVNSKMAFAAVLEIPTQCVANGGEGQVVPGDIGFVNKHDFGGFRRDGVLRRTHSCPIEKMDLADIQHVDEAEQISNFDIGLCFFARFPRRALGAGLAHLKKSGGQRPMPQARFNAAPAQQDFAFPFGNAAGNDIRIDVMNMPTAVADSAWTFVTRRGFFLHPRATDVAKVYGWMHGAGEVAAILVIIAGIFARNASS